MPAVQRNTSSNGFAFLLLRSSVCLVSLYGQQESIMKQVKAKVIFVGCHPRSRSAPGASSSLYYSLAATVPKPRTNDSQSLMQYLQLYNRAEVPARSYHWALSAWLLLG